MWPIAIARVLTVLQKDATATFDQTDSTLIGAPPVCERERRGRGNTFGYSGGAAVGARSVGQLDTLQSLVRHQHYWGATTQNSRHQTATTAATVSASLGRSTN